MECVRNPNINCCEGGNCTDTKCPGSHKCCWQDPGNGKNARLGLCVKKDSGGGDRNCDYGRGLPIKSCSDSSNAFVSNLSESFMLRPSDSHEGFGYGSSSSSSCDCTEWSKAFWVLFVLIMVLVTAVVVLKMKGKW